MASMASMANLWVHSFLWDEKRVLLMLLGTHRAPCLLQEEDYILLPRGQDVCFESLSRACHVMGVSSSGCCN